MTVKSYQLAVFFFKHCAHLADNRSSFANTQCCIFCFPWLSSPTKTGKIIFASLLPAHHLAQRQPAKYFVVRMLKYTVWIMEPMLPMPADGSIQFLSSQASDWQGVQSVFLSVPIPVMCPGIHKWLLDLQVLFSAGSELRHYYL